MIGIHELEKVGVRNAFINAIEIATKMNEKLGELRSKKWFNSVLISMLWIIFFKVFMING